MSTSAPPPDDAPAQDTDRLLQWSLESLSGAGAELPPPVDIRAMIRTNEDLPPLPEVTRRLLRLRTDPNANAILLAEIIELDPLLSTQILRWANSAYYALRRPVSSVFEAVTRALGYDLALNFALTLTAMSPLQTPNEGPIAREAVWKHGLQSTKMMVELSRAMPGENRPPPGLLQLAGVTQNIGYLLLGHLLPEHFRLLSRLIQANPTLTLTTVERFALGVDHAQLGFWLFDAWGMPENLRVLIRHHHNPAYAGEHEEAILLLALADRLLADAGTGLGALPSDGSIEEMGERLQLTAEQIEEARDKALAPEEPTRED